MYQVLELLHSEHEYDILVVGFHIIQDWLVVDTSSEIYTIFTVLFHTYLG